MNISLYGNRLEQNNLLSPQNQSSDKYRLSSKYDLKADTVEFCGVRDVKKFRKSLNKSHPNLSILEVIRNAVKSKNYINEGKWNGVFNIPEIDDFVLKVKKPYTTTLKKLDESKSVFQETADCYPDLNFGQPIIHNENGVSILKKVKGVPSSLDQWAKYLKNPALITSEVSKTFLSHLDSVSKMPQKSYDEFATRVLACTEHEIDSINPNNTLIDYKNKSINIVDLFDEPVKNSNSREDMIFSLLDGVLHTTFREKLSKHEQKLVNKYSKQIIKKCNIAGEKAGLGLDKEKYSQKMVNFPQEFEEMMQLYGEYIYK
ncbi:MAG: hypothetical protein R3Y28_08250 [Candidatus Gastranaerophilales bacterium]